MQIKVSDGKETSSLFDPSDFLSYENDEVLEFLENDGLNIIKDSDGDYLSEDDYDYLLVVEIQDLCNDSRDNDYFINKPLFDFLEWGWDIEIFEDDDVLEKVNILVDFLGSLQYVTSSALSDLTIYENMSEDEVGEELFDELGYECPDEFRRYIDFASWLEDNFDVKDIDSGVAVFMGY